VCFGGEPCLWLVNRVANRVCGWSIGW
jgi:hypothetical protein